jgi:hypothetical protein
MTGRRSLAAGAALCLGLIFSRLAGQAAETGAATPAAPAEEAIVPAQVLDGLLQEEAARPPSPGPGEFLERMQALRRENAPQLLGEHSRSRSHLESIRRDTVAGRGPLPGKWRLAAAAERDFFSLNFRNSGAAREADLARADILLEWVRDADLRLGVGITAYEGTADGGGGEIDAFWRPAAACETRLRLYAGQPWADDTYAVDADGNNDGVLLAAGGPVGSRLAWSADAQALWHHVGEDARGGGGFAGHEAQGGLRLDVFAWRDPRRSFGRGFLDRQARNDDGMEPGINVFGSIRRRTQDRPGRDIDIPVIESSADARVGVEWRQALGRRFGWWTGAFVGQDRERGIPWRSLWGANARAFWLLGDRGRLWAGWEVASESGTAVGGRTATASWGANWDF